MASRTGPASNPVNNTIVDLSYASFHARGIQITLLDLIKHILERPGYSLQIIEGLEKCIRDFCISVVASGDTAEDCWWTLWSVISNVARCIPTDHLWQDILVTALQRLREAGGSIGGKPDEEAEWEYLSGLDAVIGDFWFDPTTSRLPFTMEDVERWKNLNSFMARLTTRDCQHWWCFPIWSIRDALETDRAYEDGPKKDLLQLETGLWVATEWLLRPSAILPFDEMTIAPPYDELSSTMTSPGPLCPPGMPSQTPKRLTFWKERLLELADQGETLGLSADLIDRATRAAEVIDKFEKSRPVEAEKEAPKEVPKDKAEEESDEEAEEEAEEAEESDE